MRRLALVRGVAGLVACSTGCVGTTGPSLVSIAGTYRMVVLPADSSAVEDDSLALSSGMITLSAASRSGEFTGTYTIAGESGTLSGIEETKGALTFSTFGAANTAPLENEPFLVRRFLKCEWAGATGGMMSGNVTPADTTQTPIVTIDGSVIVQCPSPANNSQFITNTISLYAIGSRVAT
jgi:hypothetical protein